MPVKKIVSAVIVFIVTFGSFSALRMYWYPKVATDLSLQQFSLNADSGLYIRLQMWQEIWNFIPIILTILFLLFLALLFKKEIKAKYKELKAN